MRPLVGHVILSRENAGDTGSAYTYWFVNNGVIIDSFNDHITARVPVVKATIRGLIGYHPDFKLLHGKIPRRFFDLALSVMLARPEKEVYVAIAWADGAYQLVYPEQEGEEASLKYHCPDNVVLEMHSHPASKGARFSSVDDADEQGLKVYGVIADLQDETPCVNLRVGVYGYWMPLKWSDVFSGELSGVVDVNDIGEEESDELSPA